MWFSRFRVRPWQASDAGRLTPRGVETDTRSQAHSRSAGACTYGPNASAAGPFKPRVIVRKTDVLPGA